MRGNSACRRREAGTAILVTLVLIVALLGGGAVLVGMQFQSTRAAGLVTSRAKALACAEAGVVAARSAVAANYALWSTSLCNPPAPRGTGSCVIGSAAGEPSWLQGSAIDHDIDNDGNDDFVITLVDNDDEIGANNLALDNDLQIWVVSTCTSNPELQVQVMELVLFTPKQPCYDPQKLGC